MLLSDLIYDFLVTLSKRLTEVDVSTILTVLQGNELILRLSFFVGVICHPIIFSFFTPAPFLFPIPEIYQQIIHELLGAVNFRPQLISLQLL